MRLKRAHFDLIAADISALLSAHGLTTADVQTLRQAHTLMHKSGAYIKIGREYVGGYPGYKDAHFDTALRAMFNIGA